MDDARWNDYLLGDLITLQRGYDITKKEQREGPYPVVSSSGPISTHIAYTDVGPGVVIGRKGTLGKAFYMKGPYWAHDTTLWVKDFKGNDQKFVFYLLKSMNLAVYDVGSSNPTLNRNHLHLLAVKAPDVETQHRIADILSAYDDLIEVNQRRIAILEHMARRLFDEWFVRFRYPGHEAVPLIETELGMVPEGWRAFPFSVAASFDNGFAFKPEHWHINGRPIIKIRELKVGVTASTPRFADELPNKYLVHSGDVLFSWSADLDVYVWPDEDGWLNQHLFKVVPFQHGPYFIYHQLKHRMSEFQARAQGTTMRHIKRSALSEVKFLDPGQELSKRFERLVAPIHDQRVALARTNISLRAARDLLLPKLISGEIAVSAAEETFAEAAE